MVILPAIIIWVLGIPLAAFIMLMRNKKKILKISRFDEISKADQFSIVQLKMKYGFLFNGYKVETFFWEVIILYRKIFIVMTTVFFSVVSTEAQVLVVLLIIIVSLLLHIRYEPFYTEVLNRMELYSLQVACTTMYGGMFYVTGVHYNYMNSDALRWFFLLVILVPNILFFGYWLKYMRIEALKIVFTKNTKLFRMASFGMYKDNEFHLKYMANDENQL